MLCQTPKSLSLSEHSSHSSSTSQISNLLCVFQWVLWDFNLFLCLSSHFSSYSAHQVMHPASGHGCLLAKYRLAGLWSCLAQEGYFFFVRTNLTEFLKENLGSALWLVCFPLISQAKGEIWYNGKEWGVRSLSRFFPPWLEEGLISLIPDVRKSFMPESQGQTFLVWAT